MSYRLLTPRRRALTVALCVFLFLTYLLTFSGTTKSGDEDFIIDTAESMAIHQSLILNQTAYLRPIQTTDVEPGQPILAAPLYWLAYHTPGVGNVHAIFLFNPLVIALTAGLLFLFALDLGYRDRTALIAALLFGLTTIVWPYSKTFFREPLTMLNLFAAAFFANRWRLAFQDPEQPHWRWLAATAATTLFALLSKEAALLALPVLFLLAAPQLDVIRLRKRELRITILVMVILAILFVSGILIFRTRFFALAMRYEVLQRLIDFGEGLSKSWYATLAYLFSPAKGIVWYSPVLVLAPAAPLLLPRKRWRESWLMLGHTLLFAVAYAAVRQEVWHGGAGWAARYMVPLTPFLMIATLPALDRILNQRAIAAKIVLGLLVVYGFVVQLGGLFVNIHDYYGYQQNVTGLTPWSDPIVWSIRWSQGVGSLLYLPEAFPDILWLIPQGVNAHADWLAVVVLSVALIASAGLIVWLIRHRDEPLTRHRRYLLVPPLLLFLITGFALWRADDDPRYEGHNADLQTMRADLEANSDPQTVILLSEPSYVPFFANAYKGKGIWYALPLSPGERPGPDQEAERTEGSLKKLVGEGRNTIRSVMHGGSFYRGGPIYVVSDKSHYLPWAVRPVDQFLAINGFPVDETIYTPIIRVGRYLPFPAQSDAETRRHANAKFGDSIRLIGYDLHTLDQPRGARISERVLLQPGGMLGVSLVWEAEAEIQRDYTVGVYLMTPGGTILLQHDRQPVDGFAPMTTWEPGVPVRDNYGFILPNELAPGMYQVWIVVYDPDQLERLSVMTDSGEEADYLMLEYIPVEVPDSE